MLVITSWTGGHAYALQRSLRMSNQSFAAHLGVSVRLRRGMAPEAGHHPCAGDSGNPGRCS
jgi:hypothetical protein